MRGLRNEHFFTKNRGEAQAVLEELLTGTGMGLSGDFKEIEGQKPRVALLRVRDSMHDDGVDLIILQPRIKRGLMHDTAIKTVHAHELERRKNGGHTAARDHGARQ